MKIHECKYFKGKISDVTLRRERTIHCKKCGEELKDSQVEPKMLAFIKNKLKRRWSVKQKIVVEI